jgi:hypothetical protein
MHVLSLTGFLAIGLGAPRAQASGPTEAEWDSFSRTASVVTCTAAEPKNADAKRVWSAYTPKLTAYRWSTFGWIMVLELRPNPQSNYNFMGFVYVKDTEAVGDDRPYQGPTVTTPAPHVGEGAFIAWWADFTGSGTPVLRTTVYKGNVQREFWSPFTCRANQQAPKPLPQATPPG